MAKIAPPEHMRFVRSYLFGCEMYVSSIEYRVQGSEAAADILRQAAILITETAVSYIRGLIDD